MEYIKLINHCFSKLKVLVEEDIQVNYSKKVADLILGNMHLVIALLTNGILLLKTTLIALQ